ncbi:MAG: hypothetical protein JRN03_06075 [Nitrososphaerota archaeon]|nr:hypothetical protein [Nitrososphaerota archaeon]
MSNSNGKTEGKTSPKTKATKKAKAPEITKVPRLVIQGRIMQVVSKQKDGLEIAQVEAEGQKLLKIPQGRYAAVARSEFTTRKEGEKTLVLPSVSEHGFLVGIKHTTGRD